MESPVDAHGSGYRLEEFCYESWLIVTVDRKWNPVAGNNLPKEDLGYFTALLSPSGEGFDPPGVGTDQDRQVLSTAAVRHVSEVDFKVLKRCGTASLSPGDGAGAGLWIVLCTSEAAFSNGLAKS
ncbi:hypothetical protein mRhiFer1_009352 [Rhinolophus ferrumequinum]|uniref:Uncharacterized protein n=1 Tax=Rhinolophus ferrumequinum TaxID=59479 RepID=A0A7J7RXS2_RHIFE|nr:hypothetical protein mRhiFer1_009352 [Rhinolophus ferrumequinum]